jgi:hypothetical protein
MFNWFTKPQKDLDKVVDNLGVKIDDIVHERDILQSEVDYLKKRLLKIETDLRDEEFALDFHSIKVFSIERNTHGALPCTIIGHMVKDGDTESTREWYFYCSEKRHHELIDAFKKFKDARDKTLYSK